MEELTRKKSNGSPLGKAHIQIEDFFKTSIPENLLFHDINHAKDVAEAARKLGQKASLSEKDLEILEMAALFHDTGYVRDRENHEEESVRIAEKFLSEIEYPEENMKKVSGLIRSTKRDHQPRNFLEEILHDADHSHIGRKSFFRKGELFRAELEASNGNEFSEHEWHKRQYDFLINNPFLTSFAEQEYGTRRTKNIRNQRKNILSARKVTRRIKTGKDYGRGIDTLYRSNYRNHINFSSIADGKANMMISINTILISIIVTLSGAGLSVFDGFQPGRFRYTIPIFILLIGSLISVVFAVLSARPKVTEKNVDKKNIRSKDKSFLYFGNFLQITEDEFTEYLSDLKRDQQELYDSMSRDTYNLGKVLKEKYRLLSISYTVFMIGLTLSVIGFIGIFIFTSTSI
ncbi:MAG: HD domain-containing protein [Cyclobacteriaceae bacterium]|nr:HD domain-containing protein [Cyclobacteriaceae bacterium]